MVRKAYLRTQIERFFTPSVVIDQRRIALDSTDIQPLIEGWKTRWPQMGILALVPEAASDGGHVYRRQSHRHHQRPPGAGDVPKRGVP
jgi:hypothetical protein